MHTMTASAPAGKRGEIRVNTSRFGQLSIKSEKVITITSPFLGFPETRQFFLKPHGENSPFWWLQSMEDPELAFVTIQSAFLIPDYSPEVSDAIRLELQAEPGQNLEVLLILTIPPGAPEEMTANLLGPVVINPQKRLAKQVIQDITRYDVRWPVFTNKDET